MKKKNNYIGELLTRFIQTGEELGINGSIQHRNGIKSDRAKLIFAYT